MSESIFDRITAFLGTKSAVQKVADDPVLTAELLLLLHIALADGKTEKAEYAAIMRIASTDFGISPDEFGEVAEYLKDFGYETTSSQAALAFADVPFERKVQLLRHLLTIANADNELDPKEANLIRKTAETLGVTPEELHKPH
ncbi:tellurite resistance TerB family protein [Phyllobacterium sp. K27]